MQAEGHTSFLPFSHLRVYWSPNLTSPTCTPSVESTSSLCLHSCFFRLGSHHFSPGLYVILLLLGLPVSHSSQGDFPKCNCGHVTRLLKIFSKASFCLQCPKSRAWPIKIIMIWPCLSRRFIAPPMLITPMH